MNILEKVRVPNPKYLKSCWRGQLDLGGFAAGTLVVYLEKNESYHIFECQA